jgi:hypothetical protein
MQAASIVRLSKISDYLLDNLFQHILSDVRAQGQAKNAWATGLMPLDIH